MFKDGPEWLVLDPSGEPAATVVTPAALRVLAITRDRVWGVESDELDVDYIVGYRIVR